MIDFSKLSKYMFTAEGDVYTFVYKKPRKMHPYDSGNGYMKIDLIDDDGVKHKFRLNRLIIECFNPNPEADKYDVDHIDNNRQNNRLDNLQYLTHRDNIRKKFAKEL